MQGSLAIRATVNQGNELRRGPDAGLVAQLGLLVVLHQAVGLGPGGWLAGAAVGLGPWALLHHGLRRSGATRLGPANAVTLTRTVLVGGVTGLAVDSLTTGVPLAGSPVVVGLTGVALALDAVDGLVARRTGSASALGARFDMEVDAFLILVLSLLLVRPVGLWVVAIGGMRYAFVAASWGLPWLTRPLLPRYSRKVVAAVQGVVLVVAVAGVLPPGPVVTALAGALGALVWSFGVDVRWLARAAAAGWTPDSTPGSAEGSGGRSAERREEPVAEGVHAPDRGARSRAEAVVPAPR